MYLCDNFVSDLKDDHSSTILVTHFRCLHVLLPYVTATLTTELNILFPYLKVFCRWGYNSAHNQGSSNKVSHPLLVLIPSINEKIPLFMMLAY